MINRIELIQGDITKQKTDAIVNAANSSLMGGGGVDGAIHRAGGPAILDECRKIIAKQGSCKTGEAVITSAGRLYAKYVIHTVGPVWHGGNNNEAGMLANCYRNCLMLAVEYLIETIAFPSISTGIYGYPRDEAASTALRTAVDFLVNNSIPKKLYFVCFDEENYLLYNKFLKFYEG
jgi:O-acetyl-ADP-ribose deacetylase (regulator of RNase III)